MAHEKSLSIQELHDRQHIFYRTTLYTPSQNIHNRKLFADQAKLSKTPTLSKLVLDGHLSSL